VGRLRIPAGFSLPPTPGQRATPPAAAPAGVAAAAVLAKSRAVIVTCRGGTASARAPTAEAPEAAPYRSSSTALVEPARGAATTAAGAECGAALAGSRFDDAGDFEAEFTPEGNDDAAL
jgi:hypothetical protein